VGGVGPAARTCAHRRERARPAGAKADPGVRYRHELPRPRESRPRRGQTVRPPSQVPDVPCFALRRGRAANEVATGRSKSSSSWDSALIRECRERWDHVAGVTVAGPLERSCNGGRRAVLRWVSPSRASVPRSVARDSRRACRQRRPRTRCSVDGREVQKSRTSAMVFGVPSSLPDCRRSYPSCRANGDLHRHPCRIGANPPPAEFLRPAKVLSSYIEGVGPLSTGSSPRPHNRRKRYSPWPFTVSRRSRSPYPTWLRQLTTTKSSA